MNKVIQGLFLVVVLSSLALSGCSRSRGDDSSLPPVFAFQEPILVGNLEANPVGPYLMTSETGKVFVSWAEENLDGEGGRVFLAQVANDGQQLNNIRQVNHEPTRPRGGEHKAKFSLAQDDSVAAIWVTHTDIYKHRILKSAWADLDGPFSLEQRINDDQDEVSRANFYAMGTAPDGRIYITWLDGRNDLDAKEVFMTVSEDGGRSFSKNYPISTFACPCCRPALKFLDGGKAMVITYRENGRVFEDGRTDNVRNHVMIHSTDGGKTFSDPVVISDDGWESTSCPHAGISIEVDSEDRIHAIWWNGGSTPDESGIYYTYSEDQGKSFAPRQLLSDAPADKVLHTEITVDKNDTVYVAWENLKEEKPQVFLAYRGAGKGEWSPTYQITNSSWNTFYPILTTDEKNLYLSWTERKDEGSRVLLQASPLAEN